MAKGYGAVRPVHGSARLVNHTDMAHSPNFIGQLLMAEEFTPLILIAGTQSEFGSLDNFTQALTALDSVRLILLWSGFRAAVCMSLWSMLGLTTLTCLRTADRA